MKVFLVVLAVWEMYGRSIQTTPSQVLEMPSMAACEAVKSAIEDMTNTSYFLKSGSKVRCVQVKE